MASDRNWTQDQSDLVEALVRSFEDPEDAALARRLELEDTRALLPNNEYILADLRRDFDRFLSQAYFYLRTRTNWPCVVLDGVEPIGGTLQPRVCPIDFPELEGSRGLPAAREFWDSTGDRLANLPITHKSISDAREGFLRGALQTTLSRVSLLKLFGGNPKVTVNSSNSGDLVMYSNSYFFSTASAFGNTQVSKTVTAGPYCFYLASVTPTFALPVYRITADTSIIL